MTEDDEGSFVSNELYNLTFPNGFIQNEYKFYNQDIGSQTEESEIYQLKKLTTELKRLTVDNSTLRREIDLTKSNLQLEFYRRLTNASNQLYDRMNQRLDDVERTQLERVDIVRRSFKTQLSDALAQLAALYEDKLKRKFHHDKLLESQEIKKYKSKVNDLTTKLKRYEATVTNLEKQIIEIQDTKSSNRMPSTKYVESDSENAESVNMADDESVEQEDGEYHTAVEKLVSPKNNETVDITAIETQVKQSYEEKISKNNSIIEELKKKIKVLENQVNTIEEEKAKLSLDLTTMNEKLKISNDATETVKLNLQMLENRYMKIQSDFENTKSELNKIPPPSIETATSPKPLEIKTKPETFHFSSFKDMKEFPDRSNEIFNLNDTIKQYKEKELNVTFEIMHLRATMEKESRSNFEQIQTLQSIISKLRNELFQRTTLQSAFKSLHSASVTYAKNNHPTGKVLNQDKLTARTPKFQQEFQNHIQLSDENSKLLNNFIELRS